MDPGSSAPFAGRGVLGWARRHSLWPLIVGGGCCPNALSPLLDSSLDLADLGADRLCLDPRQADLLIVAGKLSLKMVPLIEEIYDQMPDPKWVMAFGACACSGGLFDTYAQIPGLDACVPVDVYVPGCPPAPEDLIDALFLLQRKMKDRGK